MYLGIKAERSESVYFRCNNGGWNKTHEQVEHTPRIDSFETPSMHGTGCLWCGQRLIQAHKVDECNVLLHLKGGDQQVSLSYSPNGFGGQQTFFLCPGCGDRVRFLYLTKRGFLCRKCAKLNYRSQQRTKGSMVNYDDGMKYAERHLLPPPFSIDGFAFCDWIPERPRYMHHSTYLKHMRRFLRYRERHSERMLSDLRRIIGPVGWSEIQRLSQEDGP